MEATTEEGKTLQQVPCCVCGSLIIPNEACLCIVCLQREAGLMNKLEDTHELIQCKSCQRWCTSIGKETWIFHEYESAGLLGLCIKKLTTSVKSKLLDAAWIWTEPHSKHLKLYVDIVKDVLDGKMNVKQRIVAEFVIRNKMCPDCVRSESDHTWGAMVQLRQRKHHCRSLYRIESELTKAGMHNLMIGVEPCKQGMDFFFKHKNQAEKIVNFISTHLPTKVKFSKKHISTDTRAGKSRFELVFAVEVVPLARHDLVLLPSNMKLKNCSTSEVFLVAKVASSIHFINPVTMKLEELQPSKYFAKENLIRVLMSPDELVRFVILDIEPINHKYPGSEERHVDGREMAEAEVARESDLGVNDLSFRISTHLGHLLKPGDIAWGYDLVHFSGRAGVEENLWLKSQSKTRGGKTSDCYIPDIVLVKKDDAKVKKTRSKKVRHSKQESIGTIDQGGWEEDLSAGEDIFNAIDCDESPSSDDEHSDDGNHDMDMGGLFDHLFDKTEN